MRCAESFRSLTHCECSVQRHLPNNTSWWTLCSPGSRSSASHGGQWPSHTSCESTQLVSMQASVQTGTGEMMTRVTSGRGGNESRHSHMSCAAGLPGGPEWHTLFTWIPVFPTSGYSLKCNFKLKAKTLSADWQLQNYDAIKSSVWVLQRFNDYLCFLLTRPQNSSHSV